MFNKKDEAKGSKEEEEEDNEVIFNVIFATGPVAAGKNRLQSSISVNVPVSICSLL